jgi:hypothetical protein
MRRARLVVFSAVITLALGLSAATTHIATSSVAATQSLRGTASQSGAREAIERAEKADDSMVRYLALQEAKRQRVAAEARQAEEHRLAAERQAAVQKAAAERKAQLNLERASRAATPPAEAPPQTDGDVHDALAICESGMDRYRHSTGKVVYHSYFQWLISTWNDVSGLPGDPHDYDYAVQKAAVQKIPLSAWSTQFPGCRIKLRAEGWAIP